MKKWWITFMLQTNRYLHFTSSQWSDILYTMLTEWRYNTIRYDNGKPYFINGELVFFCCSLFRHLFVFQLFLFTLSLLCNSTLFLIFRSRSHHSILCSSLSPFPSPFWRMKFTEMLNINKKMRGDRMALNHGANQTLEGIQKIILTTTATAEAKGTIKRNEKRMLMTKN